ncbi:MAG TPA: tetratricopeptide repeat protein [Bacteroidia bacterium]|nr:tetratricopeptide repeat protein [Bacteroidia bacterium]HNU32885.1 tetratricopeptide repeat protein [Bacteroidia bacterium]
MEKLKTPLDATAYFDEAKSLELTNTTKAVELYERIYKSYIEVDEKIAALACFKAGVVCQSAGNFKNAVKFFASAIEHKYAQLHDCYSRMGDIYAFINDNLSAIDNFFHAASLLKSSNNLVGYAQLINKAGDCYKLVGEYQNAIEQHKKALAVFEAQNDMYNQCISHFYIGNCYNWADELDMAYNFLQKSLSIADKLRNNELKIKPQGSLAILFTKSKKYDLSQDYFFQAIDNAKLTGNTTIKADLLKSLGNLYIETGDYDKALQTLEEALDITEKIQVKFPANIIHQFLSKVYERKGDYEKALVHFKSYYNLSKELNADQANVKSIGLQLKFDTEELKKEKNLAEQNLLLKDKFLASISHELRTPLNGILGMTEVLADGKLSTEQQRHLEVIKSSALNLMSVINDLFNYALLNTGQIKKEEVEFSIDDLMTSIIRHFESEQNGINSKSFKIESTVDNLLFVTDRYILEKILQPILQFVRKNISDSNIVLKVKADKVTTEQDVILKFVIPFKVEKEIESLDYFEVDSNVLKSYAEHGYESLYIGNAIKFAETLDGRVALSGVYPDYEIHFSVLVKTVLNKTKSLRTNENEVPLENSLKILLVDDNKVNQFLAKTLLSKSGYQVDVASEGDEAFKKINAGNYGIVITDIHMPGKNGYELSSAIRGLVDKKKSATPIFALTAYETATEKHKAKDAGITEFLSKPFNPNELLGLVKKYTTYGSKENEADVKSRINTNDVVANLEQVMGGSLPETKKLTDMLCEQVPVLLNIIEAAISKKDYDAAFKGIHKLKSSVTLFGVKPINDLVETLERNYRSQKNITDSLKKFDEFKKLCLQIVKSLENKF